jgi:hypothetical protein
MWLRTTSSALARGLLVDQLGPTRTNLNLSMPSPFSIPHQANKSWLPPSLSTLAMRSSPAPPPPRRCHRRPHRSTLHSPPSTRPSSGHSTVLANNRLTKVLIGNDCPEFQFTPQQVISSTGIPVCSPDYSYLDLEATSVRHLSAAGGLFTSIH